jgi:hypothetical protein
MKDTKMNITANLFRKEKCIRIKTARCYKSYLNKVAEKARINMG